MFFLLGLSLGWFSSIQFRQVFQGGLILAENYISVGRVSGGRRKPGIKAGQRYPSYAAPHLKLDQDKSSPLFLPALLKLYLLPPPLVTPLQLWPITPPIPKTSPISTS